jgi:2-beta-glucuronyltransferase
MPLTALDPLIPQTYLMITGHDYRSKRKANVHFIARELALRGPTRMFSVAFSALSNLRGRDPRIGMEHMANTPEKHEGVECYLWRTLLHPFNPRLPILQRISPLAFDLYTASAPRILNEWANSSTVVLIESGPGVVFAERLRQASPKARMIYLASDDNKTINCDPYIDRAFGRAAHLFEFARIPSRQLSGAIPGLVPKFYIPHGVDPAVKKSGSERPYGPGEHAVSIGSMLFDAKFFATAVGLFPEIKFHVIGSGVPRSSLPAEVAYYDEMTYSKTIPFIEHATFGVAPYRNAPRNAPSPYYLGDTSMKLLQYQSFGLPAVCPQFAVGDGKRLRFGYTPGDSETIKAAINCARRAERGVSAKVLSWSEVTDRLLNPDNFYDTKV